MGETMIVDAHSHMYQKRALAHELKRSTDEIEGYDLDLLLKRLDENGVSHLQIMPQKMERIMGLWLGSNEIAAQIQDSAPTRIISFAAEEPIGTTEGHVGFPNHPKVVRDVFNRAGLKEFEKNIVERGLKGLLLTPPYGHYYSNDRRVYPFYAKAVELDVPIWFHHSHMFCPPVICPLKYARIWLLEDVVIDFPELRINIEHMGYPWTEELLAIMARSPNVYTDIAQFIDPSLQKMPARRLLLARNLGMAREYQVLDRVIWGTDYVGESADEYVTLLLSEVAYIREGLNDDMERLGYPPLTQQEMEGVLSENARRLLRLES
jgi:predicted TIM-barrel fold metal-dependent hydrolase